MKRIATRMADCPSSRPRARASHASPIPVVRSVYGKYVVTAPMEKNSHHRRVVPRTLLEAKARGELEAPGSELRHNSTRLTEGWVGSNGPQSVGEIVGIRVWAGGVVLHVVDYVLLVVGMVQQVEGLRPET